jgi:hypothetical protein
MEALPQCGRRWQAWGHRRDMEYIAPYVLKSEYVCTHCGKIPPEVTGDVTEMHTFYYLLFESFRWLREDWGKAITITSGYRCPTHNREIGGVDLSLHIFGGALDLGFRDSEETKAAAKQVDESCPNVRMGVYLDRHYLHIDVAPLVIPKLSLEWTEHKRWGDKYDD